jgi:hypothetical protein
LNALLTSQKTAFFLHAERRAGLQIHGSAQGVGGLIRRVALDDLQLFEHRSREAVGLKLPAEAADIRHQVNKLARVPLELVELFSDRWSYFLTFRQWAQNLDRSCDSLRDEFGEFEYRKFRLYLWGAAYEFLSHNLDCYRMVLYKPKAAP